jgi:hypothetical protein
VALKDTVGNYGIFFINNAMNFKHFFDEREYDDYQPKKIEIKKKISNKGKFVFQDGKMLFQRVGPMGGQYQDNKRAPEKVGVWAFPFPVFDWFYVGASYSSPAKHSPKVDLDNPDKNMIDLSLYDELFLKRELKKIAKSKDYSDYVDDVLEALKTKKIHKQTLYQLKHRKNEITPRKMKRFFWDGTVYSHFAPKGKHPQGEWYKYKNVDDYVAELRKHVFGYVNDWSTDNKLTKIAGHNMGKQNDSFTWDAFDYEVFIPMK